MIEQQATGKILSNGREVYRLAYEDGRQFWAFGHVEGSKQVINISQEDSPTTSVEATKEFDYNGMTLNRIGRGFDVYQDMIDYIENNDYELPAEI